MQPVTPTSPSQRVTIDDILAAVREAITEPMAAGKNWKLVLNGAGSTDVGFVAETHGKITAQRRVRTGT